MNASAAVAAVRVIRVFVSSPGDVAAERAVLDEVVARINRTDGLARGVRLELFKWEQNVVPQIGPRPQEVVDAQSLPYDVYLGILSTRFGTPAGHYGSGTEKEFKDALKKWTAAGAPWILFYFDTAPKLTGDPEQAEQYVKVCKFRRSLEKQKRGLYDTYTGVRDTPDSLFLKADEHLRKIVRLLVPLTAEAPLQQPDPDGYLRDLLENTAHIDIRGLSVGTGRAHRFPVEQLFISLTTNRAPREARRRAGPGRPEPDEIELAEGPAAAASVPLHEALQHDRLIVVGDPGSGKTTFLNRVAQSLCQTQLGIGPGAARQQLGLADRTFPVLVKLLGCVQARAEIRRMARNPVMLTALAVVHWNERRLPEQNKPSSSSRNWPWPCKPRPHTSTTRKRVGPMRP